MEKLRCIAIGNILLGRLPLSEWRELRDEEVATFKKKYNYPG